MYAMYSKGIGLSEDSISYLCAARSFLQTRQLLDVDRSPFVARAPLYSFIMMFAEFFRNTFILIFINLAAYGFLIFTSWILIRRNISERFFQIACLLFISFSYTLLYIFSRALSEIIFLLLINIWMLLTQKKEEKNFSITLTAITVCAAVLTRYVGLFLIPASLIYLIKNQKVERKKISLFLFISMILPALWFLRNYFLSGSFTGFRSEGFQTFPKNILVMADTLTSWTLPLQIPITFRLLLFFIAAVTLVPVFFQSKSFLKIPFVTAAVYFFSLLICYLFFSFEEPRDRLLSPAFVPFSIFIFASLENFWLRYNFLRKKNILKILILIWLIYPFSRSLKHTHRWHHHGVEIYNQSFWKNSETIKWLKNFPAAFSKTPTGEKTFSEAKIFSNDPFAVYYFTGNYANHIPKKIYDQAEAMKTMENSNKKIIVWFKNPHYHFLYSLAWIQEKYRLEKIASFSDGDVFQVQEK